jgi:hypothetical protein
MKFLRNELPTLRRVPSNVLPPLPQTVTMALCFNSGGGGAVVLICIILITTNLPRVILIYDVLMRSVAAGTSNEIIIHCVTSSPTLRWAHSNVLHPLPQRVTVTLCFNSGGGGAVVLICIILITANLPASF